MLSLVLTALVIAGVHFWLQERHKRPNDAVLHIQGQTEQAEAFDFAITLFKDEDEFEQSAKILRFCNMIEARRKFNNDRLVAEQKAFQEKMAKAQVTQIPSRA